MNAQLTRCLRMIEESAAGLDDERGRRRFDGRWSIAEIVEHLDRTYTGTTKGLQRCLEAGAPRVTASTAASRLRRFVVLTLGVFPRGIPAPRHVVPSGEVALSDIVARTARSLAALDDTARAAAARFGNGPVMDHPILGPFTLRQWMRFHVVHTRHHQRQIDERREQIGD